MSADSDPIAAFLPAGAAAPFDVALEMIGGVEGVIGLVGMLRAGGWEVALDGLQDAVGRLCARVLDLPHAQGVSLRARLCALERAMAELEENLGRS